MRVPWPITIIAVLVTAGVCVIGVIHGVVQTVPSQAAASWWDFIAANAMRVAFPAAIVGAIAWLVERNIRRAPGEATGPRGFDVLPAEDDASPNARRGSC